MAVSPAAPIARTCTLVTPAGTTNDCSAPVEVNVSVTLAAAEAEPAASELATNTAHAMLMAIWARRQAARGRRRASSGGAHACNAPREREQLTEVKVIRMRLLGSGIEMAS